MNLLKWHIHFLRPTNKQIVYNNINCTSLQSWMKINNSLKIKNFLLLYRSQWNNKWKKKRVHPHQWAVIWSALYHFSIYFERFKYELLIHLAIYYRSMINTNNSNSTNFTMIFQFCIVYCSISKFLIKCPNGYQIYSFIFVNFLFQISQFILEKKLYYAVQLYC